MGKTCTIQPVVLSYNVKLSTGLDGLPICPSLFALLHFNLPKLNFDEHIPSAQITVQPHHKHLLD